MANKTLKEMLEDAQVKANAAAEAINGGKTQKEISKLKEIAKAAVDSYNDAAARKAYREWAEAGDAIKTALTVLYVPHAKKVSYPVDNESGKAKAKIADGKIEINLSVIEETIGTKHFHDESWFTKVEALGLIIADKLNEDLGNDEGFVYEVREKTKEFSFAENADIHSKNSMVKAVQEIVDAILFIPQKNKKGKEVNAIKVEGPHWVTIRESLTGRGGVGKVGISNTAILSTLIAEQCYQILNKKKNALVNA